MNKPQNIFFSSELFDEDTFYKAFLNDLENCKKEIIIESPFITTERMNDFRSVFKKRIAEGMKIFIFTRDPKEHDLSMAIQAETEIQYLESIGVQVLICMGNHHRNLP